MESRKDGKKRDAKKKVEEKNNGVIGQKI